MDTWVWVLIGVVVVMALVALWITTRARRERLRSRFGPEYDRTVEEAGSRRRAEGDLRQRVKVHRSLELRPLPAEAAAAYAERWITIQARFVDAPEEACDDGEQLLEQVLRDRGYPVDEDFDTQADLVSVDHPTLVADYREAHELLHHRDGDGDGRGERRLDDLRSAFVIHRDLFSELLEERDYSRS